MKLQINTTEKTIKIEESVNLGELIEALKNMLPDWKKYSLETNATINWISPTYIDIKPWWWVSRPDYPWITYGTGTAENPEYVSYKDGVTANVLEGTYCVEI